jgi:hypothetical protein
VEGRSRRTAALGFVVVPLITDPQPLVLRCLTKCSNGFPALQCPEGVEFRGPAVPHSEEMLNPEAVSFVAALCREFEGTRQELSIAAPAPKSGPDYDLGHSAVATTLTTAEPPITTSGSTFFCTRRSIVAANQDCN